MNENCNQEEDVFTLTSRHAGMFPSIVARKLDADGNIVRERHLAGPFPNLILNAGLDRMGNSSGGGGFWRNCQLGAGTTPPTVTDTALESLQAAVQGSTSDPFNTALVEGPPRYVRHRRTYRFPEGEAAGTHTEIGIGWGNSGSTLYSRALIRDSGGNPIAITVLPDEVLDVTYEWRIYPPTGDTTGTRNISGTDYDYTIRACEADTINTQFGAGWGFGTGPTFGSASALKPENGGHATYTGSIGDWLSSPSGSSATSGATLSVSNAAYTPGNYYRDGTLSWGLGGSGGIRSVRYCWTWGAYQIEFDPPIPKDATNILSLTFRNAWARL